MRYQNWDVLLFPEGSKVPIQEFKTQCFSTRDLDSPYLHNQVLDRPSSYYHQAGEGGPGQIPVLTTFVPSLPRGNPFRVSVHTWDHPTPTRVMETLMQPGDAAMYEVRIFIDGYLMAGGLFRGRSQWPAVIDLSAEMDKNGNQDSLRFPPFHEEILQHARWDATEVYGRIRVVVAEGFTRPHRSPPFERVRDLVVFSFQHAPLPILEQSSIAWPNPGMWQQGPRPFVKYATGPHPGVKDDEAHSHSPTRHDIHGLNNHDRLVGQTYPMWPYRLYPTPQMPYQPTPWPDRDLRWGPVPPITDPFAEGFRVSGTIPVPPPRQQRSTLTDVSMPDYFTSTNSSSRVISSTTKSSLERNKEPSAPAPLDDEQYNQLIEALSPKKLGSGTMAPANTPVKKQPTNIQSATKNSRATPSPRCKPGRSPLRELSKPATQDPSRVPSRQPSRAPSRVPSGKPSRAPSISQPSRLPGYGPSRNPSRVPSNASLNSHVSADHPLLPVDLLTPDARGKRERRNSRGTSPGGRSVSNVSSGIKSAKKNDFLTVPGSNESKRKRRGSSVDSTPLKGNGMTGHTPSKKISRYLDQEERPPETIDSLLDETSMIASGGCVLDETE